MIADPAATPVTFGCETSDLRLRSRRGRSCRNKYSGRRDGDLLPLSTATIGIDRDRLRSPIRENRDTGFAADAVIATVPSLTPVSLRVWASLPHPVR